MIGIEKLRSIKSRKQSNRCRKEHCVERSFQCSNQQGDQRKLRFKIIGTAGGLPFILRLRRSFVPDLAEQRFEACFRMMIFQRIGMKTVVTAKKDQAIVFSTNDRLL